MISTRRIELCGGLFNKCRRKWSVHLPPGSLCEFSVFRTIWTPTWFDSSLKAAQSWHYFLKEYTLQLSDTVPMKNFEQVLPRDDLAVRNNVSEINVSLCLGYINPGNLYIYIVALGPVNYFLTNLRINGCCCWGSVVQYTLGPQPIFYSIPIWVFLMALFSFLFNAEMMFNKYHSVLVSLSQSYLTLRYPLQ